MGWGRHRNLRGMGSRTVLTQQTVKRRNGGSAGERFDAPYAESPV
jgi:hypothetical protein